MKEQPPAPLSHRVMTERHHNPAQPRQALRGFFQSGRAVGAVALTLGALVLAGSTAFAQVRGRYLYTLSNFSGPVKYEWVRVAADEERGETYVIFQNLVRIYGPTGMETFSFGDDLNLGHILDAAIDPKGDIFLLSYKDSRSIVTRCNFRGEPLGTLDITGLPDGLEFRPNRMIRRNDRFYFASLAASSVIITDANGVFQKHIEVLPLVEGEDKQKDGAETIGFAVDRDGSLYFTLPAMFKVCRISPDGTATSFGRPGSAPGRFGILAGIAIDSRGNLLVADKLRCVIMVFDKDFKFLSEFGYRGAKPENLVVPDDLTVDRQDRVYVTQGRRRGVGVFALERQ